MYRPTLKELHPYFNPSDYENMREVLDGSTSICNNGSAYSTALQRWREDREAIEVLLRKTRKKTNRKKARR